uniref:Uncharacterized protein n=1 Tax=Rhizophora mucronata TaxID=61149 RepID=A0A2P2M3B4_RHIMU
MVLGAVTRTSSKGALVINICSHVKHIQIN